MTYSGVTGPFQTMAETFFNSRAWRVPRLSPQNLLVADNNSLSQAAAFDGNDDKWRMAELN